MAYTFLKLAEETLKRAGRPLDSNEIWEMGRAYGLAELVGSKGKTPWRTISAQIYTDIKDNKNTVFSQVSKRPAKFYLSECNATEGVKQEDEEFYV